MGGRNLKSVAERCTRDIAVTADNVLQYKNLMLDYWLNKRIARQSLVLWRERCLSQAECFQAFMKGISDLIRPKWIRMFSPGGLAVESSPRIADTLSDELQMLISGSVNPVDLEVAEPPARLPEFEFSRQDLRANCVYGGGYNAERESIKVSRGTVMCCVS